MVPKSRTLTGGQTTTGEGCDGCSAAVPKYDSGLIEKGDDIGGEGTASDCVNAGDIVGTLTSITGPCDCNGGADTVDADSVVVP